ncbi:MAG TPA: hypothetical protein VJJ78_01595 [Candidatus Saccharimonadales bacterium]|nr:MAG: hypothetical protein A3J32_02255 [Candidatus Saccharibacteria bacterium RIFCSPLOWO2_02_FULL_46_7]HLB66272.1 hypothetical protein [Candidatus Saccharimonadales bacterium]
MSEKLSVTPESHSHKEAEPRVERRAEKHVERHEQSQNEKAESKAKIETLTQHAKQEAVSGQDVSVEDKAPAQNQIMINKELKLATLKRTLTEVRHKLSKPERVLSKVIHQPTIDKLSSVGERTIARPSGILGAGLIALVGSTVVLYAAKHYGFSYNLSIFFILLLAGYLAGLVIELLLRLVRKKH